jgi:hypothetical protein
MLIQMNMPMRRAWFGGSKGILVGFLQWLRFRGDSEGAELRLALALSVGETSAQTSPSPSVCIHRERRASL